MDVLELSTSILKNKVNILNVYAVMYIRTYTLTTFCLSVFLPFCLSICPTVRLSVCLSYCPSVFLPYHHEERENDKLVHEILICGPGRSNQNYQ